MLDKKFPLVNKSNGLNPFKMGPQINIKVRGMMESTAEIPGM
jgi:hypothetical protein